MLQELCESYGNIDCRDLGSKKLEELMTGLKSVSADEISSLETGKAFIELLRKFREAIAENDKLHGENYPSLLNSILSVGEDGLYSNNLRFIFELIQNVDDCEYPNAADCKLNMHFDFNNDKIILSYNEKGFSPFNVFAITGIAEAAKNISASKNEIGEKGIGFKSVFGVANKVLIRSGWFSFELNKNNFTIPVPSYSLFEYCNGTEMTLFVPGQVKEIYLQIRNQYCRKEALFSKNPLLFLNKLTSLRIYYDSWRRMEFFVSRSKRSTSTGITREDDVEISVDLHDYDEGTERKTQKKIICSRYTSCVTLSEAACKSRYGENTKVAANGGKTMLLQAVFPKVEYCHIVGKGGLYSFLPTQLAFTVPVVCHAPYKLDASREFVDPQGGNEWFKEVSAHLSQLLDHAYTDWCKVVKGNIVDYIPGKNESIFASNNGKELCLSNNLNYKGSHFLSLPLFFTGDNSYNPVGNIFYFDPADNVKNPELVRELLSVKKYLFNPPSSITVGKFGISIEKNINSRLFITALHSTSKTRQCLEYLETVGYEYSEKNFPDDDKIEFDSEQLELLINNKKLYKILVQLSCDAIRKNKRPSFSICNIDPVPVSNVLYENFELSETPETVEQYMKWCNLNCFCLNNTSPLFLPCHNGIVLSKENPIDSFASFCFSMDHHDTFAIRMKLREASNQLNQYIESNKGSAADYLRDLSNIRRTVQDSLGTTGYKRYIKLILRSGTDSSRFIQELLQNADDCTYPADVVPTFSLKQSDGGIVTEYNENGFTRENIRAITAIGESTKNMLINEDLDAIGKKGIGFKTVFAIASEVKIHSGEYHFSLSEDTPTIPRIISGSEGQTNGTRMEIKLNGKAPFQSPNEKAILELCLCLRKLRKISIGSNSITIEDRDSQRMITINKRQYIFDTYKRSFVVSEPNALAQIEYSQRKTASNQVITCYVPEKYTSASEYPIYVGLPTKHKMHIPIIVDAPFELTTSREEIETDGAVWNNIVRNEMYNAIINVIRSRKEKDRANIFLFARFKSRLNGNQGSTYHTDISDSDYLNKYDYLDRLKQEPIIPTFDANVFAIANDNTAYRFPPSVCWLLNNLPDKASFRIDAHKVIDIETGETSKEKKDRIESVLNALSCKEADFSVAFSFVEQYASNFISKEPFRKALYEFLQNTPDSFHERVKKLSIIPVYGIGGGIQYVSWADDSIFVMKGTQTSSSTYWIMNEQYLAKSECEKMLGLNINEMNQEWKRSKYNEHLKKQIESRDPSSLYHFLLHEFNTGFLMKYNSIGVLLEQAKSIPLKNQLGNVVLNKLFICDQPSGYFRSKMLQEITVHSECTEFAKCLKCDNLSNIHYENLVSHEMLSADDIEDFQDDSFNNSEEILRHFYRDRLISDELRFKYELDYICISCTYDNENKYEFPEQSVRNMDRLRSHVKKLWNGKSKIISVKEECTVQKIENSDGKRFNLNTDEARNGTISIYTPEGDPRYCFCQMCRKVKSKQLIEVNNIEIRPRFYIPQLRVALCLECSKIFEIFRANSTKREALIEELIHANITDEGTIKIRLNDSYSITFTAKHLAEIQEILKLMENEKSLML